MSGSKWDYSELMYSVLGVGALVCICIGFLLGWWIM